MNKRLDCVNCSYYWRDEEEDYPSCHFPSNDPFPAPCEEDDWEDESEEEDEPADIDDDCGFDPFEGCYTYDC